MSTTDLTDHDRTVVLPKLNELPPYDHAQGFALALKLDASLVLLRGIAERYLTHDNPDNSHQVTGLPYINVLLAHGWELQSVRQFVHDMCFDTDDDTESAEHREGFMNSEEAWRICQTPEQLMEFLRDMPPGRVLMPSVRTRLTAFMAELRPNAKQNARDIEKLENLAAARLECIDNEHQFTIVLRVASRMGRRDQLKLASKMRGHGWDLVFLGYVMAKHPSEHDHTWTLRAIRLWLNDCPWQGADMLRWLIMGFQLAFPEFWYEVLQQSAVYRMFAYSGWHIVPLKLGPDGRLRATVPGKGERIAVIHQPGEQMPTGRAIVSRQQLEKLTPKHTPGGKLYTLPLTPANAPTDEQLSHPYDVFYADPHGTRGLRKVTPGKAR